MNKILGISLQKLTFTVLIGGYFVYCVVNSYPDHWHVIDSFNLIIHEAGHTGAIFFGTFIHVIAGSLFQILVPLVFIVYFYLRSDYQSSSLTSIWMGYSLFNVSFYIKDAIKMELPLLGGDGGIHDWNYLLTSTGLLSKTYNIASLVHGLSLTIMVLSLLSAIYFSRTTQQR